ncbi:MAG TPA: PHB depolymerase family esterase [Kofleriaceae bacterium]|jgi:poly(hydroxyalkanoate) depolymerase family esterase|nr:PHB depolymerase family esterase [Kofleriaceae bacterium]
MRSLIVLAALAAPAFAAQTQITSFGSNPGGLDMFVHVPANLPSNAPLVVVMHGCTQTASSMESAGWDTLADQYGFAVLYPQQTSTNNPVECFNWAGEYGNLADITRGQGENESIIQMVDTMISTYTLDTHRVFVVGFSAGAAFTSVMLATWPDRFAAGSIMEGIAYECATSVSTALTCQSPGTTNTPDAWGALVRAADSGYAGPWPRVQIWAGTSDTTVVPANATELVKQWTDVWGTDQTADSTEMIGSAAHAEYLAGQTVAVETYTISGMDHAVALGADSLGTCPGTTAQYFEDHAICSTLRAAAFFGVMGGSQGSGSTGNDTTPPTVGFEAPSSGDTVSGSVTIVIAASDNVGVTQIDIAVDGASIGTISAAPYQLAWDTTATPDGSHVLTAVAHDAAGNTATATATIAIANDGGSGASGSNGETGGGGNGLPSCSSTGGASAWPFAVVVALAFVRRRRR